MMDIPPIIFILFIALLFGTYLGSKDTTIRILKAENKKLQFEKDILIKIIRDANKLDIPPELLKYIEGDKK